MARRRRSSTIELPSGCLWIGVMVLCFGVGLGEIAQSPVLGVLLLAGGGGLVYRQVQKRQRLHEAYRLRAIRSRDAAIYHQMTARDFEEAIAFLCARDGCPEARATGKAGDLGADVIATTPDGRRLVIQCKRYVPGNLVTGPDLQKFAGTCRTIHNADIAVLVTTSGFTKQAREMAAYAGIVLYGSDALGGWAGGTGPAPWGWAPQAREY